MKRRIYIGLFTFLGFILQLVVHAVVEQFYIGLLISNFEKWSLGFRWEAWFMVHHVSTFVLMFAGLWFGYKQGKYWWVRIYGK